MLDYLFFGIFPYIAFTLFIFGIFYRFYNDRFSLSSQSSQFLGSKRSLIVGSLLWHWGIIMILTMHLLGILTPKYFDRLVTSDNRETWEQAGWIIASALIIGLTILLVRRVINPRLRTVTSTIDWVILVALLVQACFGLWIAFWNSQYVGWPSFTDAWPFIDAKKAESGTIYASSWFTSDIGEWFRSLLAFNPQIDKVAGYEWQLQFHFINGLFIIAIFPFTRLVHLFSYPFRYIWRSYQVVIWNRPPYKRDWQWDL